MQAQQWRHQLRQNLRQQRLALSPKQRNHAATRVAEHLQALPAFQQAGMIASYASFGGELSTCLIHQQLHAQQQLALPVLDPKQAHQLLFVEITADTKWQRNRYGIDEPELRADRIVPLSQIELMLLPLVGFDRSGERLGMGGGYYDRTLAAWHRGELANLIRVGVGYDFQLLEELPHEAWDVPLNLVITPSKVWDFRR